jgi:hypothetical protein
VAVIPLHPEPAPPTWLQRIPLAGIAGALITVGIFVLAGRSHFTGFECRNRPLADVASPDGRLRAVSFVRDCGDRAPRSSQLSVLPAGEKLSAEQGNVFVAELEGGDERIEARWAANDVLEIRTGKIRKAYRADRGKVWLKIRYGRLS